MEAGVEDVTFVLANKEFVVHKSHLDCLMKGLFKNSNSRHIDLDPSEVGSPEAFQVYLKYVTDYQIEIKDLRVLKETLVLVEKFEETLSVKYFKNYICSCWEEAESLNDIMCFNFKADVWSCIATNIFSMIRSDLNIIDAYNMVRGNETRLSPETTSYTSSNIKKLAYEVLNGVLEWHYGNCGTGCLSDALSYIPRLDFMEEGLGTQTKLFQRMEFKEMVSRKEIERGINQIRADFVKRLNCTVYVGCSVPYGYALLEFLPDTWAWKELQHCVSKPIAEYYQTNTDSERPHFNWNYSYFCKADPNDREHANENLRIIWQILENKIRFQRGPTPVCGTGYPSWIYMKNFIYEGDSIYLTGVRPNVHTGEGTMVVVYKIDTKSSEPALMAIGRTCLGGRRIACQLVKVGDTLHGILGRYLEKRRYGLWHFSLDLTQEHCRGIQLKPVCENLALEVVPVAASFSEGEILTMFSYHKKKNCLFALFDMNGNIIKVLGHMPSIYDNRDIEGRQFFLTAHESL